jgi:hypothetical protein
LAANASGESNTNSESEMLPIEKSAPDPEDTNMVFAIELEVSPVIKVFEVA